MPCTQTAPLPFTYSDDNQPSRKRSRETAQRLHDTVNRGAVQSIRAEGRYFTNPASIDFFPPDFKPVLSKNLCESGLFAKCLQFHLKKRLNNIHRKQMSILITGGREHLPPFLTDRMDLCAIWGRKSKEFLPVVGAKRGVYAKNIFSRKCGLY